MWGALCRARSLDRREGVLPYTGWASASRSIAPFLWSRGIRRIDDLILSHADLDHFNGVKDLAERFAIGRASAELREYYETFSWSAIARRYVGLLRAARQEAG